MDAFLGEIRSTSFNFAPLGWALCNGQQLPVAQYQALFSLLGTTFGGDGQTTFALPDLRSRVAVGTGQLPGGSTYVQGQKAGTESVTLLQSQMPQHVHQVSGALNTATSQDETNPSGNFLALGTAAAYSTATANTTMGGSATGITAAAGGNQPHENRMPYLGLNYMIALQGIFPPRP